MGGVFVELIGDVAFRIHPLTDADAAEMINEVKSAQLLAGYRGVPLAGYMPIRTEINPLPAMAEAAAHGPVGVPVITGEAQPLQFARWEPDMVMVPGPFDARIPEVPEFFDHSDRS